MDINLFFVNLTSGVEKNNFPGLFSLTPPKRSARGRENDTLIGLLTLTGTTSITPESLQAWLMKKGEEYYKTGGTVTFAMRSFVESTNTELLERNLKKGKNGNQISASLILAVIKRETLYIVNVGTSSVYSIDSNESTLSVDTDNQGRGLGVNQSVVCRFLQKELHPNDTLIFAPTPPAVWTPEAFQGSADLGIESFTRRLFNQTGQDLKAAVLRVASGNGMVSINPLRKSLQPVETEELSVREQESTPAKSQSASLDLTGKITDGVIPVVSTELVQNDAPKTIPFTIQNRPGFIQPDTQIPSVKREPGIVQGPIKTGNNVTSPSPRIEGKDIQVKVSHFARSAGEQSSQIKRKISSCVRKILPGISDESVKMSRGALIFIAIAVPLLIVAIAASVYIKNGKSQQFQQYLNQAQQYAMQADAQTNDEPSRLASLQQSLFWIDKALTYGDSTDASALKAKIQGSLDSMEGILRLELKPLVEGGLGSDIVVSQIVTTSTDLYLLDSTSGQVLRYFLTGSGYQKDSEFDCGPNPQNALNTMGKLVDILGLPVGNSFGATLFGIDAAGNIEFCVPGGAGVSGVLTPPDMGWGEIKSISLFQYDLFVLDTRGNAVYRYQGNGTQYNEKPTLYFDNQVPPLGDALDIEVNGDELYILRANGEMVECTYSHIKDYKLTSCVDPAPYGDMRTGQSPTPISFPEAQFIQMRLTQAPDSSIYLLDARGRTLFHFSLQRNLQKILHPRLSDGLVLAKQIPTGFAVSSGRIAFMAFGNLVYYAPLP